MTRYTNRSAQIAYQRCPRLAYLGQFYPNEEGKQQGLAPRGLPFQMITGTYGHKAIEFLLIQLMTNGQGTVDMAVTIALDAYKDEIPLGSIMSYGCEDEQLREEHLMLIEALIRGWAKVRLPYYTNEFDIIEVETDHHVHLVDDVEFEFKVDAVMRHKETGLIYVLSNKTTSQIDKRKLEDARSDIQGLSESWGVEQALGMNVHGVIMEYLVTGKKEIEDKEFGFGKQWIQWNPLVRGWKNATTGEIAFRFSYDKEDGKQGRLGKGWSRINALEYGGVEKWIDDLEQLKFFPSTLGTDKYNKPLESQFVSIEYYRNENDLEEWLESAQYQEERLSESLLEVESASDDSEFTSKLREHFPMFRHSCNYPVKCQFFDICHGSAGLDPMMNGFVYRTPHHQMQLGEVE